MKRQLNIIATSFCISVAMMLNFAFVGICLGSQGDQTELQHLRRHVSQLESEIRSLENQDTEIKKQLKELIDGPKRKFAF